MSHGIPNTGPHTNKKRAARRQISKLPETRHLNVSSHGVFPPKTYAPVNVKPDPPPPPQGSTRRRSETLANRLKNRVKA